MLCFWFRISARNLPNLNPIMLNNILALPTGRWINKQNFPLAVIEVLLITRAVELESGAIFYRSQTNASFMKASELE